jgi:catechol 2,3-dioxygenase-like lactoylglutathione lyase family enzyme
MNMALNQIAITVEDAAASRSFYEDVCGVPFVGDTVFAGKVTEKVQALPGARLHASWHVDDRDFVQLELFRYQTPASRPYARTRKPWDIGYSRVALEVNDVAAFHDRCGQRRVPGLTDVKTFGGKPCFAMRDPNGVLLEVGRATRPVPASRGARFAGVGISVPSLDVALRSYHEAIGCPVLDRAPPDKGALWDEPPAAKRSALLDAGTVWLEINEYARPEPRPWPAGYRISDFGLLNVAFGFREPRDIRVAYDRMVKLGFKPNSELESSAGQVMVAYLYDPQGFNVELLMVRPWLDGVMGFRPQSRWDRMLKHVMMALA